MSNIVWGFDWHHSNMGVNEELEPTLHPLGTGAVLMAKYCPEKQNYALYPDCKECEEKLCDAFFCLVVGSRSFSDFSLMKKKLDVFLQNQSKIVIVSGGANGADSLAEQYAKEMEYSAIVFPADWNKYGKSAGYVRNKQMHEFIANFPKRGCVAFWDGKSKGTQHNFKLAEEYSTPLKIVLENTAYGVTAKGNGDCFINSATHTALSVGGGKPG